MRRIPAPVVTAFAFLILSLLIGFVSTFTLLAVVSILVGGAQNIAIIFLLICLVAGTISIASFIILIVSGSLLAWYVQLLLRPKKPLNECWRCGWPYDGEKCPVCRAGKK